MFKKIFKYSFLIVLVILIIGALSIFIYLKSSAPIYEGEQSFKALEQDVSVNFDKYGIPHIYAENAEDAYKALGYVHAQDRLFQMEMIRRLSSGTLSEILGPRLVKTDKFFRMLGIRKMAEKNAEHNFNEIDQDWQKYALAYLQGVNEYVENGKNPVEFSILGIPKQEFTPTDIYSILGYMGLGFSMALKDDPITDKIRNDNGGRYLEDWLLDTKTIDTTLQPSLYKDELSQIIPLDVEEYLAEASLPLFYGSNCWVVSGEKSASGKVILSNDTHIGISQPSVWYEAHISYPGFEFYGNYLAGVPFGLIGHTKKLGWGLTIFPFDGIDLYREKANPENPNQVWANDKWKDLEITNEVIKVKGKDDVEFQRKLSRHGPIINDVASALDSNEQNPISFWWNFMSKPTTALQSICNMNYATNIEDVRNAIRGIDFIGLNVLYGDIEGNIAHWGAGRIPKRPDHVNPKFILDGASGKDELLGFYDFSDNPKKVNPPSGFIASANNDPGMINGQYFHGYYCPPNRFNRIVNHLESKEKWSQEDMKIIQLDQISDDHKKIAQLMTHVLRKYDQEMDENQTSILTALENWNGGYHLKQVEPTIYTKLLYHAMHNTMVDEVGEEVFADLQGSYIYKGSLPALIANDNSVWWDNISTPNIKEDRSDAISNAFFKTVEELTGQLGEDFKTWEWERVHSITHNHPLGALKPLDKLFNVGPYPVTAGNDVPNKMMFKSNAEGEYEVYSSPAIRILLDFANVENSESINPTGQSGNVMSPHYKDQAIMFNNGIYRPQLMDKETIKKESKHLLLKSQ